MKLLIDFGNSRCKWALLNDQAFLESKAYFYKSEDLTQRAHEIAEQICFDSIKQIHAVNVLGNGFEQVFRAQANTRAKIDIKFHVSLLNSHGVMLAYANPLSYGADRYAALIAAHHKTSGAKIIIDCGTATTVDGIEASGKHLGGLIIPGIELMCSALANKASGISMPQQMNSTQLFNDNTAEAVYSGSALVLSHGVRGIVQEIMSKINLQATVYVTGGQNKMIDLAGIEHVDCPNLVLEGLRILQGK